MDRPDYAVAAAGPVVPVGDDPITAAVRAAESASGAAAVEDTAVEDTATEDTATEDESPQGTPEPTAETVAVPLDEPDEPAEGPEDSGQLAALADMADELLERIMRIRRENESLLEVLAQADQLEAADSGDARHALPPSTDATGTDEQRYAMQLTATEIALAGAAQDDAVRNLRRQYGDRFADATADETAEVKPPPADPAQGS